MKNEHAIRIRLNNLTKELNSLSESPMWDGERSRLGARIDELNRVLD